MKRSLIADLQCPYCGGRFEVSSKSEGDAERLGYGLLRCRCFEFPVVDGILLLSLGRSGGGPGEVLQPYAPLQIAAVTYLQRNDADGLRAWMRRHLPLAAELLQGGPEQPYLAFSARLAAALDPAVDRHLDEIGRYEVIGRAALKRTPAQQMKARLATLRRRLRRTGEAAHLHPGRAAEIARLRDAQAARFYSPRANALALRLQSLPWGARVLSLCCGHGAFENLLRALDIAAEPVSIDGQLLNLLIARRYANRSGSFIVHDAQLPLPFADGAFDAVFSSSCLPRTPAQKTFALESIRVTAPAGWTFFDGIWNLESGMTRLDPGRHEGFAQNLFARLEDYVSFFHECAGPQRQIGIDVPRPIADYRDSGRWMFEPGEIDARLALRDALEISALVVHPRTFAGFVTADPAATLRADRLSVSPAYQLIDDLGDERRYQRRSEFEQVDAGFASKRFTGYPERFWVSRAQAADPAFRFAQFCAATLALLPPAYDREVQALGVESSP